MQTTGLHPGISFGILLSSALVDTAVYFNHKPSFMAVEVSNELSNIVLTAKFDTVKATSAQAFPKYLL
nr:hypothetical protein [Romeria gracilis]